MKNYWKKITIEDFLPKLISHKFLTKWLSLTTMPEELLLLGQFMFIMEAYLPAFPLCWRLFLRLHVLAKTSCCYVFPSISSSYWLGGKNFRFLFYSEIPRKFVWKGHPSSTSQIPLKLPLLLTYSRHVPVFLRLKYMLNFWSLPRSESRRYSNVLE